MYNTGGIEIMKWEAVFFDFDGVICDSVNIKAEAFAELYRPYGTDVEKKVVAYHMANGGISRFEKFQFWHREYLAKDISENQLEELSSRFSELVLKKIMEAPYIDGAIETLRILKNNNIPSYIVSGTPDDEIRYIIREKRLDEYFCEIHGSPRKKNDIVKNILAREMYNADRCIFIGDAMSDYHAAKLNSIHFLGIVTKEDKPIFPVGTSLSKSVRI